MQTKGLNGNQLKIIALITMTIDHIGAYLLPHIVIFRIIGRLAMPIFAYMIAEGCLYTKNRKKYLLLTFSIGLLCLLVYVIAIGSLYLSILMTFSFSILLIYTLDNALTQKRFSAYLLFIITLLSIGFICSCLPKLIPKTGFYVDYGIFGVLLPVLIFLGKTKTQKLILMAIGLCLLSYDASIQLYSLLSIPLLALYNGTRGKIKLKYLFYIYYPAHLGAIYFIQIILDKFF